MADGRWDLGALVKRDIARAGVAPGRTGRSRFSRSRSSTAASRCRIRSTSAPAHVPTDFQQLNALFSFAYVPVHWTLDFSRVVLDRPRAGSLGRPAQRHASAAARTAGSSSSFAVQTARSAFTLDGTIDTATKPTALEPAGARAALRVSGMVRRHPRPEEHRRRGLVRHVAQGSGQSARDRPAISPAPAAACKGRLTLDTSVPGWHGAGAVDVERLNLARWLNRDDRPSDITGHVTFDLALELGRHFPRGMYAFEDRTRCT